MNTGLRQRLALAMEADSHPLEFAGLEEAPLGALRLETIRFRAADGEAVRGLLLKPQGAGPFPAILYIHAHGNRYGIGASEMLDGRPALQSPLGPQLAAAGFAVFCTDLPCFGERAGVNESAAAKAALWRGRSLAGRMIGELKSSLDWLAERPDIDASRIGCFGISMGATFGYWLAAIDGRIAALAHLCCFADFERLIELGGHDGHGIYLTIPGLPAIASNGVIAGLAAPRPQLVGIGDLDALTPPEAADIALGEVRDSYAAAGAAGSLRIIREPQGGHAESPAMREGVMELFERELL